MHDGDGHLSLAICLAALFVAPERFGELFVFDEAFSPTWAAAVETSNVVNVPNHHARFGCSFRVVKHSL